MKKLIQRIKDIISLPMYNDMLDYYGICIKYNRKTKEFELYEKLNPPRKFSTAEQAYSFAIAIIFGDK